MSELAGLYFPIGTRFKTRGKEPKVCTVTDILETYNSKKELVRICYVATHEFLGQLVTDSNVPKSTIAIGFLSEPKTP